MNNKKIVAGHQRKTGKGLKDGCFCEGGVRLLVGNGDWKGGFGGRDEGLKGRGERSRRPSRDVLWAEPRPC